MNDTISFLVMDDHPIVLNAVVDFIEVNPQWKVICQTSNGAEAWEQYLAHQPQVLVLDVDVPMLNGLDLAEKILKIKTQQKIILYTSGLQEAAIYKARMLAIPGILMKKSSMQTVQECIKRVLEGGVFYSPEIQRLEVATPQQELSVVMDKLQRLTTKEKEILRLIANNYSTEQIATTLFNSSKTIKNHRNRICKKLELSGNYSLLSFAMEYKYALAKG